MNIKPGRPGRDLGGLMAFPLVLIAIAIFAGAVFPVISKMGLGHWFGIAIFLAILGVALLAYARLPLDQQKKALQVGDPSHVRAGRRRRVGDQNRKRIVLLILSGSICGGGLIFWIGKDLRADGALTENVMSFYKARGIVPASRAELEAFEIRMKLPRVSRSFRELTISEPTPGVVRIVSSRGFIMRSHGTHEFRVGRGGAHPPPQPIAGKPDSG